MDRASLYAGTLGTIKTFTDANSSQVCPAQTMDTTTLTEYLVQEYNGSLGEVQIGWISGAVGAPAYTMSSTGGTNGVITATVGGVTQHGTIIQPSLHKKVQQPLLMTMTLVLPKQK